MKQPGYQPPQARVEGGRPAHINLEGLPFTGKELFGRQAELALLDEAWAAKTKNVVSLVAWGGVGRSTLVNKWLERLKADTYRGAKRVFGWSFYSQGTGERVTSADAFIAEALAWFGDGDPTAGSPWAKGESGWRSWCGGKKRSWCWTGSSRCRTPIRG